LLVDRKSEGRYTKKSRENVDTDTAEVIVRGQRRMEEGSVS
jgi:hypothetical protein